MTARLRCAALLLVLVGWVRPTWARPFPADTAALEFQGFRAGAPLAELEGLVRGLGATRLHCDRAKADRQVTECRAVLTDPEFGGTVNLWVSAMDSAAGIITLSGPVTAAQLDRWRAIIERRYGRVDAQVQGTQRMMQWVRRGRMLRLTWRIDRGEQVASVSLVDGRVLDAWGQGRARLPRS
jgi:hypothetical protein